MPVNASRRVKRLSVTLAVVLGSGLALYVALNWWLHRTVRKRLTEAAARCGSEWLQPDATTIVLDLWNRSVRVEGLDWRRIGSPNGGSLGIDGRIDSLVVNDVGLRGLLFGKALRLGAVTLAVDHVNITLPSDASEQEGSEDKLHLFACGRLTFRSGPITITTADSAVTRCDLFGIDGRSVLYELQEDAAPLAKFGELDALITGVQRTPFADSALFVDTISLNASAGSLRIAGIRFGVNDVMSRAKALEVERDVIAGVVEGITISGLDLSSALQGAPSFRSIHIGRSSVHVARDKVLRDPAFVHKPLPARLLRSLPMKAGADSLLLDHLDVVYYERVEVDRGFARIPFDSIAAVVTGLRHTTKDTLDIRASAILLGRTPVKLWLRSGVADSSDQIDVDASVGRMAFAALNPVMAPLTGIAIPEGRLDTLILRMKGDDRQASARCWMRYDGLRLDRRVKKNRALDPVLNGLLNMVVKSDRTGGKEGDGWSSYAWQRRRDRALFNYLWSGVREGAKASMLPEAILKQAESR